MQGDCCGCPRQNNLILTNSQWTGDASVLTFPARMLNDLEEGIVCPRRESVLQEGDSTQARATHWYWY